MDEPLDEKALITTRDWCVQRKIDKPHYGEFDDSPKLVTKCDFMISLIDEVLAARATQAGESEATIVVYRVKDYMGRIYHVETDRPLILKTFQEEEGTNVMPLYAAPPSVTAVQAENERLREALANIENMADDDAIYDARAIAFYALAGQEKQE